MKTDVTLPEEGNQSSAGTPAPEKSRVDNPRVDNPKGVHVDFPKKEPAGASPFQKAQSIEKRLKLFLWGDSGVFKSTVAVQFPKPVVIDMEGGTDLYGDTFDFGVLKATTADQVLEAVEWLLTNRHDYRSLIIDPITIYWDALQKKWSDIFLRRNKGSKGHRFEFYDLQPKDWMTIKAEFKEFIRKLIALDMNVIVTARQKPQYKEGSFMVAMGDTFDGEKSLPYLFDTIVHLFIDETGRHMGRCIKDRSHKLPKEPFQLPEEPLDARYKVFESFFGKQPLARKPKPIELATDELKAKIQAHIETLGMTPEHVERRLASYGAESIDDLKAQDAETILKKLEAAVAAKKSNPGGSHA